MKSLPAIISSLIVAAAMMPAIAQDDDLEITIYNAPSMYIHSNVKDGDRGFLDMDVDSIVFSRRNPVTGDEYAYPVTQYVFTPDSIYALDMQEIDSISLRMPEPIYQDDVMLVDASFGRFIADYQPQYYTLDPSAPRYMIPYVGQIVYSDVYQYIGGRVTAVDQMALGTKVSLEPVLYDEIFKRYYEVGNTIGHATPEGVKTRLNVTSRGMPDIFLDIINWDYNKLFSVAGYTFKFSTKHMAFQVPVSAVLLNFYYWNDWEMSIAVPKVVGVDEIGLLNTFKREVKFSVRPITNVGGGIGLGASANPLDYVFKFLKTKDPTLKMSDLTEKLYDGAVEGSNYALTSVGEIGEDGQFSSGFSLSWLPVYFDVGASAVGWYRHKSYHRRLTYSKSYSFIKGADGKPKAEYKTEDYEWQYGPRHEEYSESSFGVTGNAHAQVKLMTHLPLLFGVYWFSIGIQAEASFNLERYSTFHSQNKAGQYDPKNPIVPCQSYNQIMNECGNSTTHYKFEFDAGIYDLEEWTNRFVNGGDQLLSYEHNNVVYPLFKYSDIEMSQNIQNNDRYYTFTYKRWGQSYQDDPRKAGVIAMPLYYEDRNNDGASEYYPVGVALELTCEEGDPYRKNFSFRTNDSQWQPYEKFNFDYNFTEDDPLYVRVENIPLKEFKTLKDYYVYPAFCLDSCHTYGDKPLYFEAGTKAATFTAPPTIHPGTLTKANGKYMIRDNRIGQLMSFITGVAYISQLDLLDTDIRDMSQLISNPKYKDKIKYKWINVDEFYPRTPEYFTVFDTELPELKDDGMKYYYDTFVLDEKYKKNVENNPHLFFSNNLQWTYTEGSKDIVEFETELTGTHISVGAYCFWRPSVDPAAKEIYVEWQEKGNSKKETKRADLPDAKAGHINLFTLDNLMPNTEYTITVYFGNKGGNINKTKDYVKLSKTVKTPVLTEEETDAASVVHNDARYVSKGNDYAWEFNFASTYNHRMHDKDDVYLLYCCDDITTKNAEKKLRYRNRGGKGVNISRAVRASSVGKLFVPRSKLIPDKTYYCRYVMVVANDQEAVKYRGTTYDEHSTVHGHDAYLKYSPVFTISTPAGTNICNNTMTTASAVKDPTLSKQGRVVVVHQQKPRAMAGTTSNGKVSFARRDPDIFRGSVNNAIDIETSKRSPSPSPERRKAIKKRASSRADDDDEIYDNDLSGEEVVEYYVVLDDAGIDEWDSYVFRPVIVYDDETEDIGPLYALEPDYFNEGPQVQVVADNMEFIDMGLSVKWANMNLGADTEMQYGDYYAWGHTSTDDKYTEDDYKIGDIGHITGIAHYDVARSMLGEGAQMPTTAQWQELIDNCEWTYTTLGGVNGYQATSKNNGNTLFFPCAGVKYSDVCYDQTYCGCYWASTQSTKNEDGDISPANDADRMHFDIADNDKDGNLVPPSVIPGRKYYGRSVRPVKP